METSRPDLKCHSTFPEDLFQFKDIPPLKLGETALAAQRRIHRLKARKRKRPAEFEPDHGWQ